MVGIRKSDNAFIIFLLRAGRYIVLERNGKLNTRLG
jgi:hypothetical protein